MPTHTDHSTPTDETTPHQALSQEVLIRLSQAQEDGDVRAFAYLYAWSAAWLEAGRPLPAPVGAFIAGRMTALAVALHAKDTRAEVIKAVAPHPKNNRTQGARLSRTDLLTEAAQTVIDLLKVDNSRGRRKSLVDAVAKLTGYATTSIDRAISKLRNSPRD